MLVRLIELLKAHRPPGCKLVFPSPTGNREYHMLDHCKAVAKRAALDEAQFDLKTFRSTYATRALRTGAELAVPIGAVGKASRSRAHTTDHFDRHRSTPERS